MKAYLHLEDNPYKQSSGSNQQRKQFSTNTASPELLKVYEEADLLPHDIPSEYQQLLPEKVIFHAHRFMEITRVLKGRAIYIVDKKICLLHPGDIIVFNSFIPHTWLYLDEDVENIDYSFSNTLLTESVGTSSSTYPEETAPHNLYLNIWHTKPTIGPIPVITSSDDFIIKGDFIVSLISSSFRYAHIKVSDPMYRTFVDLLDDIDKEGQEKQFAYEYILHAKLMELVAQLFRLHSGNCLPATQKKPELLLSALEYISENLNQNLRLETVAKHCYLTPQYFSSYFKKYTGMNFSKYLNELRLERALNELIQTDKSILEIAYQCGFNSKTSFYRAWYSKHQIAPTQIRNMYSNKSKSE